MENSTLIRSNVTYLAVPVDTRVLGNSTEPSHVYQWKHEYLLLKFCWKERLELQRTGIKLKQNIHNVFEEQRRKQQIIPQILVNIYLS